MWNILFLLVTLPVHMYNHYNVMYSILQRVFDGLPLQNPHLDTVWLRLPPPGDSKALLLSNHPPAGKTQISRGMLLLNKMKYFPVPKQKIIDAGIMLRPTSTYRSQGVSWWFRIRFTVCDILEIWWMHIEGDGVISVFDGPHTWNSAVCALLHRPLVP